MSVIKSPTATEAPPEHPGLEGRSSLDIAIQMFFKRRGAVIAGVILVVLYLAAIWAPLLATARPLHFRGMDRPGAEQAARVARLETLALVRALSGAEERTVEQVRRSFEVVDERLAALVLSAGPDLTARAEGFRATLAGLRSDFDAAAGSPPEVVEARPETAQALTEAARAMKSDLVVDDGSLVARTRWPAFRALDGVDVALLVVSIVAFLALPFMRRHPLKGRRPRLYLATLFGAALVGGFGWSLAVDSFDDPTDYRGGIESGAIVAESVTWAVVPWDLNQNNLDRTVEPPSADHRMGTDESGRDLLSRLLWGARVSLSVGFVAVGIYVLIGIYVGAMAGYFGGWVDIVISRIIEVVICFPVFFLILVIAAFLADRTFLGMDPPKLVVIMVIIGVTGWPFVARLVRAEFLKLVAQDFVMAARSLGAGGGRIIFRHVLPNALAPVLVAATFGVASAILLESALSFLGVGITVPTPSWGGMLFSARGYEQRSTWIFLWPGLAIFLTVTCYNLVGEALRDAMDPRLRE